eukprot:TRINITY_DN75911_c0_g1_i1.p1 TRINITY_DN75911_c0_g1~~TRINITY_DN75911_c0_g1_i1.p1  ORF type:complete len:512 (-),score=79.79 TRINITY_DN75911_c0_g1_i1:301-1836(-)
MFGSLPDALQKEVRTHLRVVDLFRTGLGGRTSYKAFLLIVLEFLSRDKTDKEQQAALRTLQQAGVLAAHVLPDLVVKCARQHTWYRGGRCSAWLCGEPAHLDLHDILYDGYPCGKEPLAKASGSQVQGLLDVLRAHPGDAKVKSETLLVLKWSESSCLQPHVATILKFLLDDDENVARECQELLEMLPDKSLAPHVGTLCTMAAHKPCVVFPLLSNLQQEEQLLPRMIEFLAHPNTKVVRGALGTLSCMHYSVSAAKPHVARVIAACMDAEVSHGKAWLLSDLRDILMSPRWEQSRRKTEFLEYETFVKLAGVGFLSSLLWALESGDIVESTTGLNIALDILIAGGRVLCRQHLASMESAARRLLVHPCSETRRKFLEVLAEVSESSDGICSLVAKCIGDTDEEVRKQADYVLVQLEHGPERAILDLLGLLEASSAARCPCVDDVSTSACLFSERVIILELLQGMPVSAAAHSLQLTLALDSVLDDPCVCVQQAMEELEDAVAEHTLGGPA